MSRQEPISHKASEQLLNGDTASGAPDIMKLVSSCVSFAYVEYKLDDSSSFYYSDGLLAMLGFSSRESFSQADIKGLEDIISGTDLKKRAAKINSELKTGGSFQTDYRLKCQDGKYIRCLECGHMQKDTGRVTSIILNLSPLERLHSTFVSQLRRDRLTNLYNKETFCRKVAEVLKTSPADDFEIMRFNIARFKVINDLFGEGNGDRLLKYVAAFLKNIQLEHCVYGRLYADNFVLFYPVREKTRQKLIHSLQLLAESFALDYRVDFYFGVYAIDDRTIPVSSMLDRASMSFSKAAHNGLITCGEYDDDMRKNIVNEQIIVNNMQSSLKAGNFLVYMQPKYDIMSGRIVGAEALVRWQHPQLGFIPPNKFIPIFEQNGFIYQLDKYIWEETCKLLRKHIDEGRELLPISVNASRVDLYSPNIVQVFDDLIKKYRIPTYLLEIELTESAYIDNPKQIIEITKELQNHSFTILMDDFGSGYSSLNMLKDMPVNVLKIDLKFLANQENTDVSRGNSILSSVVHMAKNLKMPVIVEGVETAEQVEFLKSIGCEYGQGYYYARPIPIAEYEKLLDEQSALVNG